MKLHLAKYAGFCFGVERALEFLNSANMNNTNSIYTLGPLIHNPQVIKKLKEKGIKVVENLNDINIKDATVIFRTHGVVPEIYNLANKKNFKIIDATCPYVKKVQEKAKELADQDYKVLIIGDPEHPEVIGIKGWSYNKANVINNISDIDLLEDYKKVGVVAQTTLTNELWDTMLDKINKKFHKVKAYKTICTATEKRQSSAIALSKKVDKMLVIGGFNSSNTHKLVSICKTTGINTYHIEKPEDISRKIFNKNDIIGITAGASTPDWIIKEVIEKMKEFSDDLALNNEKQNSNIEKEDSEKDNQNNINAKYEETFVKLSEGDIVKGNVVQVSQNEIMVNVGYKSDGIIPINELSSIPFEKPEDVINVDDEIEVCVVDIEDKEGNLILSKKEADTIKAWENIEHLYNENEIIETGVINEVKGGLLVDLRGLRGFVPASHVSLDYIPDLSIYKNNNLRLKIIELDKSKNRVVLSHKIIMEEEKEQMKKRVWENIKEGDVIEGKVQRITDFGAFVDIGGIDGLVHISELSWGRINHPSEVLEEGNSIKVKILGIDQDKERISLGLKQVLPDPWTEVSEKYPVGSIIEGKVVKLVSFGAFIEVEPGIEGLVHISQISDQHIPKPDDVLEVEQKVKVKVLEINENDHKISLSIKDAVINSEKNDNSKEEKEDDSYKINNEEGTGVTIGDMVGDLFEKQKEN